MFDHGVLNIFPSRCLDQSILVAVLVGIFVLLFLTETLGWVGWNAPTTNLGLHRC